MGYFTWNQDKHVPWILCCSLCQYLWSKWEICSTYISEFEYCSSFKWSCKGLLSFLKYPLLLSPLNNNSITQLLALHFLCLLCLCWHVTNSGPSTVTSFDLEAVKNPFVQRQKYFSVPNTLLRGSTLLFWSVTYYIFIVRYLGAIDKKNRFIFNIPANMQRFCCHFVKCLCHKRSCWECFGKTGVLIQSTSTIVTMVGKRGTFQMSISL